MNKKTVVLTAAVLVLCLAACSFSTPDKIRIKGLETGLFSTKYDFPFALDKIRSALPEGAAVSLYNPGDGVQHLLVGANIDEIGFELPLDLDSLSEGLQEEQIDFEIIVPEFIPVVINATNNYIFPISFDYGGSLPKTVQIGVGKLAIKPLIPVSGLDLSGTPIFIFTQNKPLQTLSYLECDPVKGWLFSLDGVTLDTSHSSLLLGGSMGTASGTFDLELTPYVDTFSSVTLTSSITPGKSIQLMYFGSNINAISGEFADYLYSLEFNSLEIVFECNMLVQGLSIGFSNLSAGISATGTSSLTERTFTIAAENVSFEIVNPITKVQLLSALNVDVKLGSSEVTLHNVVPGDTLEVTVTPIEVKPNIRQAVVNPNAIPNFDLKQTIPEAGEAPINLEEMLEAFDEILPLERLTVSPVFYAYLNDNLPAGMQLKAEAIVNGGTPQNVLSQPEFNTIDLSGYAPVLNGNEYTGTPDASALSLNIPKLLAIAKTKTQNLRLTVEPKLPDPGTIDFSFEDGENKIMIKPDLLIDIPLEFEVLADTPAGEYATIQLVKSGNSNNVDFFGRKSAADPIIGAGGIALNDITLTLKYENTMGIQMDLLLTSTNFERIISLSPTGGGVNTVSFNLSARDLPYPFKENLSIRLPADQNGPDGNYAVLKIVPGGHVRVTSLGADITFDISSAGL